MIETRFLIQGEKTRLNRWMEWAMVASLGGGVIGLLLPQGHLLFVLSVILFVGVLIWSIAATASEVALYEIQGRLEINEQSIKVSGVKEYEFQSASLQRVEVKFSSYRGQAIGRSLRDGSGNLIGFYPVIGTAPIVIKFLADSHAQSRLFVRILNSWRAMGVKVVADGIDLV